jgi:hypothetical protein
MGLHGNTAYRLSANDPGPTIPDDPRFRALLSDTAWQTLSPAIRRRFSKRLADGKTATYVGEIAETHFTRLGWWLAQASRLIGGPLPTGADAGVPSIVTVTEDMATGGQIWSRIYTRRRDFPQVIHSSKRFEGPTGLEEYIGRGIAIALRVSAEHGSLVFTSVAYLLQVGPLRLRLPNWLTPGTLTVTHEDVGDDRFRFALQITHPLFGVLIRQSAVFREASL